MTHSKNTTGGGCLSRTNLRRRSPRKLRLTVFAAMLALVAAFAMPQAAKANVLDDLANGAAQFFSPIVQFFTGDDGVQTLDVEGAATKADPDTSTSWTNFTAPGGEVSTQNIGRVWTDKTVTDQDYEFASDTSLDGKSIGKGQSNFLVGLSALSSASNVRTSTTTSVPLDVVLVIDRSGSMDDPIGEIDSAQMDQSQTYMIYVNSWFGGYYQDIVYNANRGEWGYDVAFGGWTSVDVNTRTIYQSKMSALQGAVDNFIDSTEASGVDARIALVSFAEGATVDEDFTDDWDELKREVGSLNAINGTYSDEGFEAAKVVMNGGRYDRVNYQGARSGAQRVVIFFTDGEPGSGGSVQNDVAAPTVNTAHDMKDAGSLIYTIGVVDGADPSDTSSPMNKFMHAVSSNYPDATANERGNNFASGCDLGTRTPNSDYYKAATDATELNGIFEDISKEITEDNPSGSPIIDESTDGNTDPNPLTFSDTLGAYMEVTGTGAGADKMQVVYGNQIKASDSRTSRNIQGGVEYTYNFSGTVGGNGVYGEADLSDLSVTVTHYDDPSKGDVVTATIPADLLPLRYYSIDENNNMTVSEAYPIRLFYGVSLRQEAKNALADPTAEENQEIFEKIGSTQVSSDKKTIDFYTNAWKDPNVGETTASFMPNESNKFYYFTTNTPLYTDAGCQDQNRASWQDVQGGSILYYRDTYYVNNNGKAEQRTEGVAVTRNGIDWDSIDYDRAGNAYIPGGTQREDRPATLVSEKDPNETGTASTVLTPEWIDATRPGEHDSVSQHLGNNGKYSVPNLGSLEIKKAVSWGNASDSTKQTQGVFTFGVTLTDAEGSALEGPYAYEVFGQAEEPTKTGTVSNGGTLTIDATSESKPELRVVINDLPAGAKFTISEQGANQNGFATVDGTSQTGVENEITDGSVSGTIEAGTRISVDFTNTYSADKPVNLSTWGSISAQKDFNGRDWRDTDSFEFNLAAAAGSDAPMPAEGNSTKVVTNEDPVSFGDIQFTKAGTYTYYVTENNDVESRIAGVDYSDASYRVDVVVADGGNGNLKIDSVAMTRVLNDDNQSVNETISPSGDAGAQAVTALFANTYSVETGNTTINGKKSYTDGSGGGNPISDGKFSFQIEPLGGYETGSIDTEYAEQGDYTVDPDDVPMPRGADDGSTTYVVGNVNDGFAFGPIDYHQADVDKTFEYRITERGMNLDGQTEANMGYDTAKSHVVKVVVTDEKDADGEGAHIVATVSAGPDDLVFTNTFAPDEVTLGENDAATINGTKAVDGRDMTADDNFTFSLTPYGETTSKAIADGTITGITSSGLTTTVIGPADEHAKQPFSFSDITFTKVGAYQFLIDETNEGESSGLTYDTKTCVATVTVTVDHATGDLVSDVTYDANGSDFVNDYNASVDYSADEQGGLNVSKTMAGDRTMKANEFTFTVTGKGPDGDINETLGNGAAAENGTSVMSFLQSLSFDQDDKDVPFSFTVKETFPDEADRLPGVTYDQSEYKVTITPRDNGDGTMYTETVVMRTKDAAGVALEAPEQVGNTITSTGTTPAAVSFTNTYNPSEVVVGENAEYALQVEKTVTGAPSPDSVTYGFTLTPAGDNAGDIKGLGSDGSLHVSTNGQINVDGKNGTEDDSQLMTFADLTFTKAGTYTFTVSEDDPAVDAGWTFDTSDHTVTVEVVNYNPDNNEFDGNLHVKSVTGNPVSIKNSYHADPVVVGGDGASEQISVKKTVTGHATTDEQDFHFTIAAENSNEWAEGAVVQPEGSTFNKQVSVTDAMQAGESKTVNFGALQFNAEGTYQFTITEYEGTDEINDPAGWTYDDHTVTVTVEVTDEGDDGQLDAKVSYDNSGAKTDADRGEQNAAAFTNSYSTNPGTLTGGGTTFNGTKVLDGRQWLDNETFGFTMKPVQQDGVDWSSVSYKASEQDEAAAVTADSSWTAEATANGNDEVAFWFPGTFTFSKAGTYTFNVTENAPAADANGMTYDRHTGVITVEVTDNGQGQLVATAKPGDVAEGADQNNMTFTNYYEATPVVYGDDASEILGGEKSINDTTGGTYQLQSNTFDFIMRRMDDANPLPNGLDVVEDSEGDYVTVKNAVDNGRGYDFGEITFTHDDMVGATDNGDGTRTKEFSYNIFESDTAALAGISYSNAAYRVTFTVTEDLKSGEMTVVASARTLGDNPTDVNMEDLDFVNTYDPTLIEGHQNIFKRIEGRNWLVGDAFTFNVSMTATELDGSAWTGGAGQLPKVSKSTEYTYDLSSVTANDAGNGFSYSVIIQPTDIAENTYRFDTGTVSYEREGVYTYTVSEGESGIANVTEDARTYTVKVTVTDVAGKLQRKVEITPEPTQAPDGTNTGTLGFTNTYVPNDVTTGDDATTGITVQKTLSGRAWEDGDAFTFEIARGVGNTDGPLPTDTTIEVSGTTGATTAATKTFGSMTFTKAMLGGAMEKDFAYTITETSTSVDGIAVDSSTVRNATVTVVDDGTGQLKISKISYDNATSASADADKQVTTAAAFTNVYDTGTVDVDKSEAKLTIIKIMTGRAICAGDFTFTMTGADQGSIDRLNGGQPLQISTGDAELVGNQATDYIDVNTGMTFALADAGKTYIYTVKEVIPEGAALVDGKYVLDGVTYDTTEYKVEFKVTDAGGGKLKVETLVNGELLGDAESAINALGTAAPPTFNNSYDAGSTTVGGNADVRINATKALKNDDIAGYVGKFHFQVKSGDTVVATGSNNTDNGRGITFSAIEYTTAKLNAAVTAEGSTGDGGVGKAVGPVLDDEGNNVYTFAYDVVELKPSDELGVSQVTVDSQKVIVKVTDSKGILSAEVSYPDSANGIEFVNTYGAASEKQIELTGNKVIKGANEYSNPPKLKAGDYTFTLTGHDGAPMPDDATGDTVTAKNDDNGLVTFGPITFTMENVFGDDSATGETTDPDQGEAGTTDGEESTEGDTESEDDATNGGGATTDEGPTTEGENAKDENADGETTEDVVTDGTQTDNATGTDSGPAVSEGAAEKDDDSVTSDDATLPSNDDLGIALLADEDTGVQDAGRTKTFKYTIQETAGHIEHVLNDSTVKTVTVTVTDLGGGNLGVTVTPDPGADDKMDFTFTNTYFVDPVGPTVPTDNAIDVIKKLTGRELKDGDFTFEMKYDGESTAVTPTSITTTNSNSANGSGDVEFGDGFTFSEPGTYDFTIREVAGSEKGMTYDSTTYTVRAKVTDNADGTLSCEWVLLSNGVEVTENPTITFTNKYDEPYIPPTPTPDETDPSKPDLDVDKTLTGRDMVAGEFSFTITATGDNADHVSPKTLTGTNDASGNVSFSGEGFTFDEAGEYTFTVSEVLPQDDDPETPGVQHNGVTYDETTYDVTAKVTNGAGNKLVAKWDLGTAAGGVTFKNAYEPDETANVSLGATKVLNGRDLVAGEFTFELVDGQGNVVATATNAADGSVFFSSIEFTEAGTYTYLIREVAGSLANVTYDTATHTATVTVTDNGDGTLTATVLYDGSGSLPVFTNTYKVPEEPGQPERPGKPGKPEEPKKPATPDTGDHTNAAAPVALALSGAALVAGAYVLRVRRNR